jgi:hypothetical protein
MTRYDKLAYLLGAYGSGFMTEEVFWAQMKEQRFGQADIDQWCEEHHRKETVIGK